MGVLLSMRWSCWRRLYRGEQEGKSSSIFICKLSSLRNAFTIPCSHIVIAFSITTTDAITITIKYDEVILSFRQAHFFCMRSSFPTNFIRQFHNYFSTIWLACVFDIAGCGPQMAMKAQTHDLETHPHVPIIVAHDNLAGDSFSMTAALE